MLDSSVITRVKYSPTTFFTRAGKPKFYKITRDNRVDGTMKGKGNCSREDKSKMQIENSRR